MDPYLELSWGDVRAALTVYACDAMRDALPDGVYARLIETECYDDVEFDPAARRWRDEPTTYTSIEIRDFADADRLLTRVAFLDRIQEPAEFDGEASLVEIDLLRRGFRTHDRLLLASSQTPYRITVRRPERPEEMAVYPAPLQSALPVIAVPARSSDPDIALALQPLLVRAYDRGSYALTIDYSRNPQPPLEGDDAAWADELLRAQGLR
jgi:hypothetical protein